MDELKLIKKYYGEDMMHLCRTFFSTLLDRFPGKLFLILDSNFEHSKFLYEDIKKYNLEGNFKNYIYSFIDVEQKENEVDKTPSELLKEVGYTLYECQTEKDIEKFKKYYAYGEELCTFNGGRLNNCYVFFAVKDNVDEIKRKDFKNPERQDEYGTSVISIQFTRDKFHSLSIKNRYNHRVTNPDATFSNNLDNIIVGLTKSFEKYYGLKQQIYHCDFEIPNYVRASDGKFYKYNYEINNVYYCPNNVLIDHFSVVKLPKEKYIIMDCFILDTINKEIKIYLKSFKDSFIDSIGKIKDIKIKNIKNNLKEIAIKPSFGEDIIIILDNKNRIIKLKNNNVKIIGDEFLNYNEFLEEITLLDVEEIGDDFLVQNNKLKELYLPNLEKVGKRFMSFNVSLEKVHLPNLKEVKNLFLFSNGNIKEIGFKNLEKVGNDFMFRNKKINELNLPYLKQVGENFFYSNEIIETIDMPSLENVGNYFLYDNHKLTTLIFPSLNEVGDFFLALNKNLVKFSAPNLKKIGICFLNHSFKLQVFDIPYYELDQYSIFCLNDNLKKIKRRGDING